MAYIPVDNVCQAELFYTWDGQLCETVLHFEPDVSLTPTMMTELGAFLVSWWDTQMQTEVPTTLTLNQIKFTDLTIDIGPVVNYSAGLPLTGTDVSPSLPNSCALVITKRTILRGRSYRGRIYHPGLTEADVTGNTVSGTFVAALISRYSMLLTPVTSLANWNMVVISRRNGGVDRTEGVATPVVSLDSDGRVDSQRRRLPGRGS